MMRSVTTTSAGLEEDIAAERRLLYGTYKITSETNGSDGDDRLL
jgi:hypothetical protein